MRSTPAGAFSDKFLYFLRLEIDKKHSLTGFHSDFNPRSMKFLEKMVKNHYKFC